ncbi:MAG: squalene synthase HpnD [Calditrichaeota bacterium]|nr:presqualene diphosphate synthase HpnD [Calditrichota bacterium]RQW05649.1 MAG: squalene synthase HpnD [Calditrichota bacterium]
MSQEQIITRKSRSNFYYAFSVLPREKREAIYTLYSFCRQADDIADGTDSSGKKLKTLDYWEIELFRQFNSQSPTRFDKIWKIAQKFRIPLEYFLELINGIRMDLAHVRFSSIEDLINYCYRVASVVGLMSIQIFGYRDERVKEYAINLGIALQLTNIMRDVGVDAEMGRVYLPLEDLEKFGVTEQDIIQKKNDSSFFRLMNHQYQRARDYYRKAGEILPTSERRNMIPSQIMKNIYYHLLQVMERKDFNVLQEKTEIPRLVQISIAFKTVLTEAILSI